MAIKFFLNDLISQTICLDVKLSYVSCQDTFDFILVDTQKQEMISPEINDIQFHGKKMVPLIYSSRKIKSCQGDIFKLNYTDSHLIYTIVPINISNISH